MREDQTVAHMKPVETELVKDNGLRKKPKRHKRSREKGLSFNIQPDVKAAVSQFCLVTTPFEGQMSSRTLG